MKTIFCAVVLSVVMSAGLFRPTSEREHPAVSISVVLRAHNAPQDPNSLTNYASEGVMVVPYEGSSDGKAHNFFVHRVSALVRGGSFRYDTVDFNGSLRETYISDGTVCNRSLTGRKGLVNAERRIGEMQFKLVESRVWRFGLLPFLRRLSDPRTEATYLGRTESGNDKFEVKTPSGTWTLLSDESGLIQRLEIGKGTIVFSDYRSVEGVQLPFNERVLIDGRQFYELSFDNINLKPKLDGGLFNSSDWSEPAGR